MEWWAQFLHLLFSPGSPPSHPVPGWFGAPVSVSPASRGCQERGLASQGLGPCPVPVSVPASDRRTGKRWIASKEPRTSGASQLIALLSGVWAPTPGLSGRSLVVCKELLSVFVCEMFLLAGKCAAGSSVTDKHRNPAGRLFRRRFVTAMWRQTWRLGRKGVKQM